MMLSRTGTISTVLICAILAVAIILAIAAVVTFDAVGKKGNRLAAEYHYIIDKERYIDPAMITYEPFSNPIMTGFDESTGIAVDGKGLIYISGDTGVNVFTLRGQKIDQLALNDNPRSLFVFGQILYLCMKDYIQVIDLNSKQQSSWPVHDESSVFTSIAGNKNSVFVADAGNRYVIRYNLQGQVQHYIGQKDEQRNIPGFVIPSPYFDLLVADDGLLRVVNPGRHRIEAYTPNGDLELFWGTYSSDIEGFCGCCNPAAITMLPDGSMVTSEKGLTRVKVYDPDGRFKTVVAGPEQLYKEKGYSICEFPDQCQKGGFDLASVDEKILVLDTADNLVRIFQKSN